MPWSRRRTTRRSLVALPFLGVLSVLDAVPRGQDAGHLVAVGRAEGEPAVHDDPVAGGRVGPLVGEQRHDVVRAVEIGDSHPAGVGVREHPVVAAHAHAPASRATSVVTAAAQSTTAATAGLSPSPTRKSPPSTPTSTTRRGARPRARARRTAAATPSPWVLVTVPPGTDPAVSSNTLTVPAGAPERVASITTTRAVSVQRATRSSGSLPSHRAQPTA